MPNFFEKLKKGMGIEPGIEQNFREEEIEKPLAKKAVKRPKKTKVLLEQDKPAVEIKKLEVKAAIVAKEPETPKEEPAIPAEPEIAPLEIQKETERPSLAKITEAKEKWSNFGQEQVGQLAIDVYQTENDLVIQSAIAGVKPETLDVIMEKDIIAIKGAREKPFEEPGDYFSQECYWGPFSREVILPTEVDPNKALAELKDGILTIRIPKLLREKKRKIVVRGS